MNKLMFLILFIFSTTSQASLDYNFDHSNSVHSIVNVQNSHNSCLCEPDLESETDIEVETYTSAHKNWSVVNSKPKANKLEALDLRPLYSISSITLRGPPIHS